MTMRMERTCKTCKTVQYTTIGEFGKLPDGWRNQPCVQCKTPTLNEGTLVAPTKYKAGAKERCLCRVLKHKRFVCMYHQMRAAGYSKPDRAGDDWLLENDNSPTVIEQYEEDDERGKAQLSLPKARLVPFGLMNHDLGIDTEYLMQEVLPSKKHWKRFPWRTSDIKERGYIPGLLITKPDGTQIATGPRGGESKSTKYTHAAWTPEELERKQVNKANSLLNLKQNRMNPDTLGARVKLEGGKQA